MLKKFFWLVVFISILLFLGYKTFEYFALNSFLSDSNVPIDFEIKEKQGVKEIGENLEDKKIISNKYFFYFYIWKNDLSRKLQAGNFKITPNLKIPQIVSLIISRENSPEIKKITIPEGFTNKKIIERVENVDQSLGSQFEKLANCLCYNENKNCDCGVVYQKYDFVKNIPPGVDAEGYFFPDTYFLDKNETAETLVMKFFDNFKKQVDENLLNEIDRQGKNLHEIITMASIIEKEAKTEKDRRVVSGIFWKRISDNYPLQSCATLAYVTGIDKAQYSIDDTETDSPYNTYKNSGLPPGPIANPGLDSIKAAIYPEQSDYYFFLTDQKTGEMVYSRNLEEHNRNKALHGL